MLQVPCPVCGHLNPISAVRCEECGQLLGQTPPRS